MGPRLPFTAASRLLRQVGPRQIGPHQFGLREQRPAHPIDVRRKAGAVDQAVGHDVDGERDGGFGEARTQPIDQRLVHIAADHEVDVCCSFLRQSA
jgi:hypothetical protein